MEKARAGMLVALVLAAACLMPAPASATGFCSLKKTADGFVALRAGPSPDARLIGRMKQQDEVLIGLRKSGNWVEVTWWRGQDRHHKGYDRIAGRGWANARYIQEEC